MRCFGCCEMPIGLYWPAGWVDVVIESSDEMYLSSENAKDQVRKSRRYVLHFHIPFDDLHNITAIKLCMSSLKSLKFKLKQAAPVRLFALLILPWADPCIITDSECPTTMAKPH